MHFSKIAGLFALVAAANAAASPVGMSSRSPNREAVADGGTAEPSELYVCGSSVDKRTGVVTARECPPDKRDADASPSDLYSCSSYITKRDFKRCIEEREAAAEAMFECAASAEKRMISGRCTRDVKEKRGAEAEAEAEERAKRTCLRSLDEKRCTCIGGRDASVKDMKRCIVAREALTSELRECASSIGKRMLNGRCMDVAEREAGPQIWGTCPTGKRDLEGRCIKAREELYTPCAYGAKRDLEGRCMS